MTRYQKRVLAEDALICASLLAIAYATPARLRPALSLFTAVSLSRVHGRGTERVQALVLDLFDQRNALTPRVEKLEGWAFGVVRPAR